MPIAAIKITNLFCGHRVSHCFDECIFIYTRYSCFYSIRQILGFVNVSGGTRTPDLLIRSEMLYPSELLRHEMIIILRRGLVKPPIVINYSLE